MIRALKQKPSKEAEKAADWEKRKRLIQIIMDRKKQEQELKKLLRRVKN